MAVLCTTALCLMLAQQDTMFDSEPDVLAKLGSSNSLEPHRCWFNISLALEMIGR